jgi:hypothetical protein
MLAMDGQQLWVAEEEHVGKNPPTPTTFHLDDDAFADGDDNDSNYEFSPIAIRAEFARAVSSHEIREESPDADAVGETSESHTGVTVSLLVRRPAYLSASTSPALQGCLGSPP